MIKIINKYKFLIFVTSLFILSAATLFIAGNFNKQLNQYWDEMRFYEIAKNIYLNKGIVVRNIPSDFQKILYPLLISPVFGIANVEFRLKIINLINSITISSSFIPIYFIAKEVNLSSKTKFVFLLICFFSPVMIYSVGFMSEILAYPLTLWLMYLFVRYFKNNNYIYPILIGIFLYILYLCKETAFFFLISFCIYQLFGLFFIKNKKIKFNFNKKIVFHTLETVSCFFLFFVIFKFTIFKGMGNSYDQTSIEALNSFKAFIFLIYGFIYYLLGYSLSVLILPIIIPILVFKKMNGLCKRIFTFFVIFIIVAAASVSYTIYIREEPGELVLPMHLRYTLPFSVILLCLQFSIYQDKIGLPNLDKKKIISLLSFAALFILIFKGSKYLLRNHDLYSLIWLQYIQNTLKNRFITYTSIGYILSIMIIDALILSLLLLCYYVMNKKKTYKPIIATTACVFIVSYSLAIYTSYNNYRVNDVEMNELKNIDNYIFNKKRDSNILIVVASWFNTSNAVDLYIDKMSSGSLIVRQNSFEDELEKMQTSTIQVSNMIFYENTLLYKYPKISHLDYFLLKTSVPLQKYNLINTTKVEECSGKIWHCFSNNSPATITIKNIQ